ncbi:MAG TPA: phosphoribosylaminoimidazolesuccinocarboxamide synthase [bacterium]|jgi:phosphoribosylaminoimidazole-succinocarboxamide synthase
MKLIYAGSVKNLYLADDANQVWFEYTDDYSVFDWGKMPDPIPGKGEALARLGEWFFQRIADPAEWKALGLADDPQIARWLPIAHHFMRREGNRLLMTRVEIPVLRADNVGGNLVYDYGYPPQPRQLIPLEVIFRFGVPAGSSLLQRKSWYPFDIHEGAEFDEPLIEFSTKLEMKDRVISYQEAALILKGNTDTLAELHGRTRAVAHFLRAAFARHGLKLWDGKLEWALVDGKLTLVDSIGPDELRVSQGDAVFSKQFLRNFYLGTDWYQAVLKGGELARKRGTEDWIAIVKDELRQQPGPLSAPYRQAAEALYGDFLAILVQGQDSRRFQEALGRL